MIIENNIETKEFENVSAGPHAAVLVDNVDLGLETVEFEGESKEQHKMKLVFEVDQKMEDGRPMVIGRKMTANVSSEKATLRQTLETWLGRPLTGEEQRSFDLDSLIGTSANIMVIHNADKKEEGKVWANIDRVYPAEKKLKISGNYTRVQDR